MSNTGKVITGAVVATGLLFLLGGKKKEPTMTVTVPELNPVEEAKETTYTPPSASTLTDRFNPTNLI